MNPDFPKKTPSLFQYQPRQIAIPGAPTASEELTTELQMIADKMNDATPACGELTAVSVLGLSVSTTPAPLVFSASEPTANIGVEAAGSPPNRLILSKGRGTFKVSWGAQVVPSNDGGDWTIDIAVNGTGLDRSKFVFAHGSGRRYGISLQNIVQLAEGDYVQVLVSLASGTNQISYYGAYLNLQRIA